jgi:hypothetical protein
MLPHSPGFWLPEFSDSTPSALRFHSRSNVLTSVLLLRNNQHVDLAISSKEFAFERAQARVFPSDWDSTANLSQRDPLLLFEPTELVNGRIISAAARQPGEFMLLLSELTVRRLHDNRSFDVPWFAAQFNLTDPDVQKAAATVLLNPTGVFRVSIFDRTNRPLHRRRQVMLHWGQMNIQLVADENGAVLLLDNPTHFRFDTETTKIAVESL